MITIEIAQDYYSQIEPRIIEVSAQTTLQHQSAPEGAEMTIVITNDKQLQALNHQYLFVDAPTDVLSFPVEFLDPENEAPYIGDIIISYPRAASQAAIGGHAVTAEIQLLVIHGVLHLLGHDHAKPSEKTKMWNAQEEILNRLGLGTIKMPEGE